MTDSGAGAWQLAGIAIRAYQVGDGDSLRALWLEAGFRLVGDDEAGLARFAARNPGSFLVAERAGRIVGSAMGGWDGRRGWLHHVATAPDCRRLGLGSILVRMAEDAMRAVGCQRCLVIVENGNAGARAFWLAQGYVKRDTEQLARAL